jgi:hypothetical protein
LGGLLESASVTTPLLVVNIALTVMPATPVGLAAP